MQKKILATLIYSDLFDFPLTRSELWQWLILDKKELGRQEFDFLLGQLLNLDAIRQVGGFHFLAGREEIVLTRKKRARFALDKLRRAEKAIRFLRFIPWVQLIGVTGGLARKNADQEDDIDLFFVTSRKRLWITRGLVVLLLALVGLYRRPKKIANMICPNMFVSEEALEIQPHDLFIAHEVCLMRPLFERDQLYFKFLRANEWVFQILPHLEPSVKLKRAEKKESASSVFLVSDFLNFLERVTRGLQIWYMGKKRTSETLTDKVIKFHPQDVRERILREYKKRLASIEVFLLFF